MKKTFKKNPKSNTKIVERQKETKSILLTHELSLSWLGTCTSIESDVIKLII
jgi:hypothetical protein